MIIRVHSNCGWASFGSGQSLMAIDCALLLTSNLVSHSLGLNDGNVIDDPLVVVEILGQSFS